MLSWPQNIFVAEDCGRIVGYVLAKMDDESESEASHGHITSLSVLRTHRKLGLATKLMRASEHQMKEVYDAEFCSLHVRVTNRAAIGLYKDALGYEIVGVEEGYYADGEDAYDMKHIFKKKEGAKEEDKKENKKETKKKGKKK